jgi:hypothetical protein
MAAAAVGSVFVALTHERTIFDRLMPQEKPLPKCKAMLLCDRCMVEPNTGKPSLIGVFHEISCQRFPILAQPFTVFLELIEGIGQYDIFLQVNDLDLDRSVATTPVTKIEFANRLIRSYLMIPIAGLPIMRAGFYDFCVFANGELLEQQSVKLSLIQPLAS